MPCNESQWYLESPASQTDLWKEESYLYQDPSMGAASMSLSCTHSHSAMGDGKMCTPKVQGTWRGSVHSFSGCSTAWAANQCTHWRTDGDGSRGYLNFQLLGPVPFAQQSYQRLRHSLLCMPQCLRSSTIACRILSSSPAKKVFPFASNDGCGKRTASSMPLPRLTYDTAMISEASPSSSTLSRPKDSTISLNSLTWPGCTGKVAKRAWCSSRDWPFSQAQKSSGRPLSSRALHACTASDCWTNVSLSPACNASSAGCNTTVSGGVSKKLSGWPIFVRHNLPRPLATQRSCAPFHFSDGVSSKSW
mmetsp:Transcript_49876/g.138529  ORF Transcript_49876/g.138529 Transcript_49876/m.138529 type:complete len:305 (-) Transcript_49876:702-1616(-)